MSAERVGLERSICLTQEKQQAVLAALWLVMMLWLDTDKNCAQG